MIIDYKEIGFSMRNWIDSVQDKAYWRAIEGKELKLRV